MNEKTDKNFGIRLREYRKKHGISGTELAKTLEISQGSLSEIETGKTKASFKTIENIVRKTEIDLLWLITGKEAIQEARDTKPPASAFLNELEMWAREISGQEGLRWLEKQLEECLPTWRMWREKKKAETDTHQIKVA